jgi:hypothetical protein
MLEEGSYFVHIEGFATDIRSAAFDLFTAIHTYQKMSVPLSLGAYVNKYPIREMVSAWICCTLELVVILPRV